MRTSRADGAHLVPRSVFFSSSSSSSSFLPLRRSDFVASRVRPSHAPFIYPAVKLRTRGGSETRVNPSPFSRLVARTNHRLPRGPPSFAQPPPPSFALRARFPALRVHLSRLPLPRPPARFCPFSINLTSVGFSLLLTVSSGVPASSRLEISHHSVSPSAPLSLATLPPAARTRRRFRLCSTFDPEDRP